MEVPHKKTIFEKLKEIIPLVTPLLMFSAIAFTYFTYFFDINKTPQIIVQNTITKIHETDEYYIVKLSLKLKNQSKTRVEIIANLGKLYAYNGIFSRPQNDSQFIGRIIDTTMVLNKIHIGESFELHQNLEWKNQRLIGFYQPIHNASWMLPEETLTQEIVTAVPKTFDVIYYYYTIDFSDNESGILNRYTSDEHGDPEYEIFTIDGDDTISLRKENNENFDSLNIENTRHKIYVTSSQFVAWLNTGKSFDILDSASSGESKDEK